MPQQMHDWTLMSVNVNWEEGIASLEFISPTGHARLQANGLQNMHIPRARSWGPSSSVLVSRGLSVLEDGLKRLSIQMQTGDCIEIVARSFDLPEGYVSPDPVRSS